MVSHLAVSFSFIPHATILLPPGSSSSLKSSAIVSKFELGFRPITLANPHLRIVSVDLRALRVV